MAKKDKLVEISLGHFGGILSERESRLSVYFNYDKDNHHIQFKEDVSRGELLELLKKLCKLIKNGGN